MKKTITCTVCPSGCTVTAEYTCKQDITLSGNKCKRGVEYCIDECFDPRRTFTSSVKITGSDRRRMPVRTSAPVPKDMISNLAQKVKEIEIDAPVQIGTVIERDVLGTGADLIAAMTLGRKE